MKGRNHLSMLVLQTNCARKQGESRLVLILLWRQFCHCGVGVSVLVMNKFPILGIMSANKGKWNCLRLRKTKGPNLVPRRLWDNPGWDGSWDLCPAPLGAQPGIQGAGIGAAAPLGLCPCAAGPGLCAGLGFLALGCDSWPWDVTPAFAVCWAPARSGIHTQELSLISQLQG